MILRVGQAGSEEGFSPLAVEFFTNKKVSYLALISFSVARASQNRTLVPIINRRKR